MKIDMRTTHSRSPRHPVGRGAQEPDRI